jgi:C4-dicarboxylate-specific signal transduction histidine kinase
VDLNQAIREVISLSLTELRRNRVILQPVLADDLPRVNSDRVQLQHVILNLLRNASDAMLEVEDRRRTLLVSTEREIASYVRFMVQESGNGLDRQSVGRFSMPSTTTKIGGMGIGVSVSVPPPCSPLTAHLRSSRRVDCRKTQWPPLGRAE